MAATLKTIISEFRMAADIFAGGLAGTITRRYKPSIVVGAAAGQVNLLFDRNIVVATGVPLDTDLTATTDPNGNAIAFAKLTHIAFLNLSDTVGEDFTLGGGANPAFAAMVLPVPAKLGALFLAMPYNGITIDATHKTFRVAVAAGAAVNAYLMLFGRS